MVRTLGILSTTRCSSNEHIIKKSVINSGRIVNISYCSAKHIICPMLWAQPYYPTIIATPYYHLRRSSWYRTFAARNKISEKTTKIIKFCLDLLTYVRYKYLNSIQSKNSNYLRNRPADICTLSFFIVSFDITPHQ